MVTAVEEEKGRLTMRVMTAEGRVLVKTPGTYRQASNFVKCALPLQISRYNVNVSHKEPSKRKPLTISSLFSQLRVKGGKCVLDPHKIKDTKRPKKDKARKSESYSQYIYKVL